MRYWVTHPDLSPDHDHEIEAEAIADWSRSGWRIRDDQTAPVDPELAEALAAAAAEAEKDDAVGGEDAEHETPAADVEPDENDDDTEEGS